MSTLDTLITAVHETEAGEAAAIVAINGLADKVGALAANSLDPAQAQALADEMRAKAKALSDAIANPGTPAPVPTPAPTPTPTPAGP